MPWNGPRGVTGAQIFARVMTKAKFSLVPVHENRPDGHYLDETGPWLTSVDSKMLVSNLSQIPVYGRHCSRAIISSIKTDNIFKLKDIYLCYYSATYSLSVTKAVRSAGLFSRNTRPCNAEVG